MYFIGIKHLSIRWLGLDYSSELAQKYVISRGNSLCHTTVLAEYYLISKIMHYFLEQSLFDNSSNLLSVFA